MIIVTPRVLILFSVLYIQSLAAIEYSPPDEQGIHAEQLTLISQTLSDGTVNYRACVLFETEWQCHRIDPSRVEACAFQDKKFVCTSPTQSDTLQMLEAVIDGTE